MATNKHKDYLRLDNLTGDAIAPQQNPEFRIYLDHFYGLKGIDASGTIHSLGVLNSSGVIFPVLPTGNPHVANQVWNLSGALQISTG